MNNANDLQKLLDSIGAMSEILMAFYKQLRDRGFNEQQALYLTGEFIGIFKGERL